MPVERHKSSHGEAVLAVTSTPQLFPACRSGDSWVLLGGKVGGKVSQSVLRLLHHLAYGSVFLALRCWQKMLRQEQRMRRR